VAAASPNEPIAAPDWERPESGARLPAVRHSWRFEQFQTIAAAARDVAAAAKQVVARAATSLSVSALPMVRRFPRSNAALASAAAAAVLTLLFFVRSDSDRPDAATVETTAPLPSSAPPAPVPSSAAPVLASRVPPAPAEGQSGLTVRLVATSTCWVRAVSDGRRTTEHLLKIGDSVEIRAAEQVVLRVGDAGAVSVTVNGRAVPPLGARGAVVTRRISRADTPERAL
jgi:hypothetical protein